MLFRSSGQPGKPIFHSAQLQFLQAFLFVSIGLPSPQALAAYTLLWFIRLTTTQKPKLQILWMLSHEEYTPVGMHEWVLSHSVVSDSIDSMDQSLPGSSVHRILQTRSGLPCSSPGDLPDPGTEPMSFISSALAGRFFTTTWEAHIPV